MQPLRARAVSIFPPSALPLWPISLPQDAARPLAWPRRGRFLLPLPLQFINSIVQVAAQPHDSVLCFLFFHDRIFLRSRAVCWKQFPVSSSDLPRLYLSAWQLAAISKHPSHLRNTRYHWSNCFSHTQRRIFAAPFVATSAIRLSGFCFCLPLMLIPETKILACAPLSSAIALHLPVRPGQRRC